MIKQYTYGYDLASNRTSELVGTVTTASTPNNVNEITGQSGGVTRTLSYDANGSITSDGGTRTFEWDGANRLSAVNYTGTNQRTEFSYDGLSRCTAIVEKAGGVVNSTRRILWCGTQQCEFRNASSAVQYQLYPQGQYQSSTAYFYTRDHLGSVREMTNSSGTVVGRYDYDPYGRSSTIVNTTLPNYNFTGLYQHAKSGLDMAVYRFYDPDLGRWLNRDPIAERGGLDLYTYSGNEPVNLTDLLGLLSQGAQSYLDAATTYGGTNLWLTFGILKAQREAGNPLDPCLRDAEHYAFAAALSSTYGEGAFFGLGVGIPLYSFAKVPPDALNLLQPYASSPSWSEVEAGYEGAVAGYGYGGWGVAQPEVLVGTEFGQ